MIKCLSVIANCFTAHISVLERSLTEFRFFGQQSNRKAVQAISVRFTYAFKNEGAGDKRLPSSFLA